MPAAGNTCRALLYSDGSAIRIGANVSNISQGFVDRDIPAIQKFPVEDGIAYTQVACCTYSSHNMLALLRSDGKVLSQGVNTPHMQTMASEVIEPEKGTVFTQVSLQGPAVNSFAGFGVVYLLRNDGRLFRRNTPRAGLVNNDELIEVKRPDGVMKFTQVAAGGGTLLVVLSSDGRAFATGSNEHGQCNLPELDADCTYTQVSAGQVHTALLRSDGSVTTTGRNTCGQRNIPELAHGIKYTQVSAGGSDAEHHTVLLCSNGEAVAVGANGHGQCNIPRLKGDNKYTQVSAGGLHTVLVCNDGSVVAVGKHTELWKMPSLHGHRTCMEHIRGHPQLDVGVKCIATSAELPSAVESNFVVQLSTCAEVPGQIILVCTSLAGVELAHVPVDIAAAVAEVKQELLAVLAVRNYMFVLPNARLLSEYNDDVRLLDTIGFEIAV